MYPNQQPFGAPQQQGGYGVAPPPQQGGWGGPPNPGGGPPRGAPFGAPQPFPGGGVAAPPPPSTSQQPPFGAAGGAPRGFGAPGMGGPPPQGQQQQQQQQQAFGGGAPGGGGFSAPPGGFGAPPPQQPQGGAPPPGSQFQPPAPGGGFGGPPRSGGTFPPFNPATAMGSLSLGGQQQQQAPAPQFGGGAPPRGAPFGSGIASAAVAPGAHSDFLKQQQQQQQQGGAPMSTMPPPQTFGAGAPPRPAFGAPPQSFGAGGGSNAPPPFGAPQQPQQQQQQQPPFQQQQGQPPQQSRPPFGAPPPTTSTSAPPSQFPPPSQNPPSSFGAPPPFSQHQQQQQQQRPMGAPPPLQSQAPPPSQQQQQQPPFGAPFGANGGKPNAFLPPPQGGAGGMQPPPPPSQFHQQQQQPFGVPPPNGGFLPPPPLSGSNAPPQHQQPGGFGPPPPLHARSNSSHSSSSSSSQQQQQNAFQPPPLPPSGQQQGGMMMGGGGSGGGSSMGGVGGGGGGGMPHPQGMNAMLSPHGSMMSAPVAPPPMVELDPSRQCLPGYMNLTLGAIPKDEALLKRCGLPLGLVCHPLSEGPDSLGKGGIPLVNNSSVGVIRCRRCRAYINPFAQFVDGGRRWRCNFCAFVNDVPQEYFSPTDTAGNREDVLARPELSRGSVEFVAPVEYMVRPPQPPVYVFVLDVSYSAVSSGILATACAAIKEALPNIGGGGAGRSLLGFITHDTSVHFYAIKKDGSMPSMLVVPDLEDLFVPTPHDLLVNLSECYASIVKLLDAIPSMFANTRVLDSALGPALEGAYAISSAAGGKMCVVQAALPSLGPGRLKNREVPKSLGSEKEKDLFAPDPDSADSMHYKNRAPDFSKAQLSVDFFLFNPNYSDVASLGSLSRYTSGQVYWYGGAPYASGFSESGDGVRFRGDLVHDLTRTTAFEAVMRVRATRGVAITNFYGNFFIRGQDLLALPNASPDTAFSVELTFDPAETLPASSVVSVQAALLYTSSAGERRIAVHTLARPVTTVLADMFKRCDCECVANIMSKVALDHVLRAGLTPARKYLHKALVDIVRAYRLSQQSGGGGGMGMGGGMLPTGMSSRLPPAHRPGVDPVTGAPYPPGSTQGGDVSTMLPECLETLPLLTLGLQKSFAFRGGDMIRSDERSALVFRLLTQPTSHSRHFAYPKLYPLHNLPPGVGKEAQAGVAEVPPPHPCAGPRVKRPSTVALTSLSLDPSGCFLLDSTVELYLWVGKDAPKALIESLWGAGVSTPPPSSDPHAQHLPDLPNDFSARVRALVRCMRAEAPCQQRLRIVTQGSGDVNEYRFMCHLVEDPQNFQGGTIAYGDYMTLVLKESLMPALGGGMGGVSTSAPPM